MENRIVKFKTSVVGGFDRQDVISYIKKLSGERNELRARLNKQEGQIREAYEQHRSEYESADEILYALEIKHREIGEQIADMREHLKIMREAANLEKN